MDTVAIVFAPVLAGMTVGAAVGHKATRASYASVKKPAWSPPPAVFGIVWTVLYLMMGVASWRVWITKPTTSKQLDQRSVALALYAAQLVLNLAWSPIYFSLGARRAALALLILLDVLVLITVAAFARVDVVAAWLLAPYVAWLCVATALNVAVVWTN